MKRCALNIFNGQNILGKSPSSRISKSKSPIRRIVRVEETSNSPLQARGDQRKRVIIKGRDGTEIHLKITLQTIITKKISF